MSFRIDHAELRLDKAERLENGWLRVEAVVGRVGLVEYTRADGSRFVEYRPPEEVFSDASLRSGDLAPVTNDHPPTRLDARNTRQFSAGSSGVARREGDLVVRQLLITDEELVKDVLSGKRQVSPGYTVKSVPTPGTAPDGRRYDAIQTNIQINHHAVVDLGRQGPDVSLRMDSGDAVATSLTKDSQMKINDVAVDAAQATAQPTPAAQPAPPAPAAVEVVHDSAKLARLQAENDVLKARLDSLEQESKARFGARVQLHATAQRICGDAYRSDADDLSLMSQVVLALDPAAKSALEANKANEGYLRARYDMALEAEKSRSSHAEKLLDAARSIGTGGRSDAELSDLDKAARKVAEDRANAWKTPTAK